MKMSSSNITQSALIGGRARARRGARGESVEAPAAETTTAGRTGTGLGSPGRRVPSAEAPPRDAATGAAPAASSGSTRGRSRSPPPKDAIATVLPATGGRGRSASVGSVSRAASVVQEQAAAEEREELVAIKGMMSELYEIARKNGAINISKLSVLQNMIRIFKAANVKCNAHEKIFARLVRDVANTCNFPRGNDAETRVHLIAKNMNKSVSADKRKAAIEASTALLMSIRTEFGKILRNAAVNNAEFFLPSQITQDRELVLKNNGEQDTFDEFIVSEFSECVSTKAGNLVGIDSVAYTLKSDGLAAIKGALDKVIRSPSTESFEKARAKFLKDNLDTVKDQISSAMASRICSAIATLYKTPLEEIVGGKKKKSTVYRITEDDIAGISSVSTLNADGKEGKIVQKVGNAMQFVSTGMVRIFDAFATPVKNGPTPSAFAMAVAVAAYVPAEGDTYAERVAAKEAKAAAAAAKAKTATPARK